VLRFGLFEVQVENCELRKQGVKIRLQEQPFRLLAILLERSGQVVTREELREKLWGTDTFVDFDKGLNKAINRIRDALEDSAENPRFIETVPKRGYRFIAPVDRAGPAETAAPGAGNANPAPGPPRRIRHGLRETVGWGLAALFLVVSIWFALVRSRSHGETAPVLRVSLLPPPKTSFLPYSFALSPDGTRLAFVALDADGNTALWIRALSASTAQRLDGTEGAAYPFWSLNNQHVGFFARRKLKTLDFAAGTVRVLADAPSGLGGAWNRDGVIVFAPTVAGPLYRVGYEGGAPVAITSVSEGSGQSHCLPVFLPDGRHFFFYIFRSVDTDPLGNGIHIGELGSTAIRSLSPEIAGTVAYSSGHLLYARDRSLVAQPFDLHLFRLTGSFFPIAEQELDVAATFSAAGFTVSGNGEIIFRSTLDSSTHLAWFDRSGKELGSLSESAYRDPTFSPDGRYLAIASDDAHNGKYSIRVHDLARGVSLRLTEPGEVRSPIWSPDGKEITYASAQGKLSFLYRVRADGSDSPRLIRQGAFMLPHHWSHDGHLIFTTLARGLPFLNIYSTADGSAQPFGPGVEAQFSPDGKWIAYIDQGGVAGGGGVVAQPFPGPGPHIQVSGPGGAQPRWSRDGRQIYYMAPDRKLMSVAFDPSGTAGQPQVIFQTRIVAPNLASFQYDIAPDGRFLINSFRSSDASPLTMITGWQRAR